MGMYPYHFKMWVPQKREKYKNTTEPLWVSEHNACTNIKLKKTRLVSYQAERNNSQQEIPNQDEIIRQVKPNY